MESLLGGLLRQSLRFEFRDGNIAHLKHGHTTGWRTLPYLMCSQAFTGSEALYLENGVKVTARPGELLVLPAGVLHKVDVVSSREARAWVHVNYYILTNLDLFSLIDVSTFVPRRLGRRVGEMIHEWVGMNKSGETVEPIYGNAKKNEYGFRLLAMLAPVCKLKPDALRRMERTQALWPVIQHIHNHFGAPIDRRALAAMACLSPARFHSVFKETTGVSPIRYLQNVRIRHAQQRLIATQECVFQIGAECGYEDPFVFSKFFKRICGVSPTEYRARIANG